jgi:hypothetical protein
MPKPANSAVTNWDELAPEDTGRLQALDEALRRLRFNPAL